MKMNISDSDFSVQKSVPAFLSNHAEHYALDPLGSAVEWFRNAKFGLFMHYGLYSLLGRGEWVQHREKIYVHEYEKLKNQFTAENFDARFIVDLAIKSEMKYVNITTRHHDGFCLFNTKMTDFNSVNSPAKRDLVEELANECARKGIGLALYYSHGRDWRHPHAPNNGDLWGGSPRPEYDPPETYYKYGDEHDLNIYIDFMNEQFKELLANYGDIASIWLDGFGTPMSGPTELFRIPESYEIIREMQPHCLITSKWGYLGTEDYFSPEYHWLERNPEKTKEVLQTGKPLEICHHIAGWGYAERNRGRHRGSDSIWKDIEYAASFGANLLLNTAPRPDGSIDPQDIISLREVGNMIRRTGWPQ